MRKKAYMGLGELQLFDMSSQGRKEMVFCMGENTKRKTTSLGFSLGIYFILFFVYSGKGI
jgi:hypothetical protein